MKLFISDIHLGDGTGADDFHRDDLLLNFLDYADKKSAELVILGDLFELWQSDLEKIFWKHPAIIRKLQSIKNITYIYGNHDYLPFSRICAEVYEDDPVVALHGHQYDQFNRFKNPLFNLKWPIGKYITVLVGELERWVHPDADTWLLKMKEKFGNFLVEAAFVQNKSHFRGDLDQLAQTVEKQRKANLAPISIFGHTHEPELSIIEEDGKKRIYANTGAWVDSSYPTFLELTNKYIRLCDGNDLDVLEEVKLNSLG